jgi:hypothetical protein
MTAIKDLKAIDDALKNLQKSHLEDLFNRAKHDWEISDRPSDRISIESIGWQNHLPIDTLTVCATYDGRPMHFTHGASVSVSFNGHSFRDRMNTLFVLIWKCCEEQPKRYPHKKHFEHREEII